MTAEQRALRETVRALLDKHASSELVRAAAGFDPKLWELLCGQVGVAGLSIPEAYGGAGATLLENALVLEELGRTLAPAPLLGSAVLAAHAILATGDEATRARLLPPIADGTAIAALACSGPAGDWTGAAATASRDGVAGHVLDGEAHFVLDGDIADLLVVLVDGALFEVDPDAVERQHTPAMDLTRRLALVRFDAAPARLLGRLDTDRLRDIAVAALAAEQVGTAARALDLTVGYAKHRVQFGQPIGAFQALQHRMADMYVLVESARSAAYAAAQDPDGYAAVAKVACSEALRQVAAELVQLHGGIAITWEHDAHLYFKRAHGSALLFGSPETHLARLATQDWA
ncbi:MAG: acyl-CoA dehydrogenase family protein [Micromonosporaceae bacterium]